MAKNHSSNIGSQIVAGVMAFLLSVFMLAALALPILYFTVFSTSAFTRTFRSVDYYEHMLEENLVKASDQLLPTGLPPTVLEGVLTAEELEMIGNSKVRGTSSEEELELIAANMQNRMLENIYRYMQDNNIPDNLISTEDLNSIVLAVTGGFESNATFPMINQLRSYFSTYFKLMIIGVIVCIGLSVLLAKLLDSISAWRHVFFRSMAFSTGGTSLMLLALPLAALIWGGYKRVNIQPEYMYLFFQKLISNTLWSLLAAGVVVLAVTVVLAVLSEKSRKKVRHHKRRRAPQVVGSETGPGLPDL